MDVNCGGTSISTVDWYGRAVLLVAFRGCPLRCYYCQNRDLLQGEELVGTDILGQKMLSAKKLVSAVVFTGGEPLMQYGALRELCMLAKRCNLLVGIETSGYYPERMEALIRDKLVDRVFLDIKAPFSRPGMYGTITGSDIAAERAGKTLRICRMVPLEVRTTLLRSMDAGIIREIAASLDRECTYVVQQGRPEHAHLDELPLTRDELLATVSGLKGDIRIRTKESGEEKL